MIKRNGPRTWKNIHVTNTQSLEDLMDVDNSNAQRRLQSPYDFLNQASGDLNALIQEAKAKKKKLRAIGSAWALSPIQSTDHWLVNTKLLNKCFEADADCFHPDYPQDKRPLLVIAQCGISIAELNVYLELPREAGRLARSMKTTGIGAGQTVVGAVSGNTHGAAVNFGALPDFVAAIQLCNGTDKPLWIERSDRPVMNETFFDRIQSKPVRDTDIFNSALVSFGAFGIITAFAIETAPLYQIVFPVIKEVDEPKLASLLADPGYYSGLYHLEFVFNPHEETYFLIEGTKVNYEEGHPIPKPLWIVSNASGYAPGDRVGRLLLKLPLVSAARKSKIQFKEYLKNAVLSDVRGTSGQLFTATITYLEGFIETALAVSLDDTIATLRLLKQATRDMKLPIVVQVRIVHPGDAVFGFTCHFPKSVVVEFGMLRDSDYPKFEELILTKLRGSGIRYSLHWSKNSLVDPTRLLQMYGTDRIETWKRSRQTLFNGDADLMDIFNHRDLKTAGLA
ncbi:MAG TPA: hypothetical protein VIU12_25610 [Chryseolinea sp.]